MDAGDAGLGHGELGLLAADQPAGELAEIGLMAHDRDRLLGELLQRPCQLATFASWSKFIGVPHLGRGLIDMGDQTLCSLAGADQRTGEDNVEANAATRKALPELFSLRLARWRQGAAGVIHNAPFAECHRVRVSNQVYFHAAASVSSTLHAKSGMENRPSHL